MITLVAVVLLVEVLVVAGVVVHRLVRAPSSRRPLVVLWVAAHVLPLWYLWRAVVGWVLACGSAAAVRAVEGHERVQASATFPPGSGGV